MPEIARPPADTPATTSDGETVEVRLSYLTDYGEHTIARLVPLQDLESLIAEMEGFDRW